MTTCTYCDGAGYLPDREAFSATGEQYLHHTRCHTRCAHCQGFSAQKVWIEMTVLQDMLVAVTNLMDELITPIPAQLQRVAAEKEKLHHVTKS